MYNATGGEACYNSLKYGFFDLVNLKYDSQFYPTMEKHLNLCLAPGSADDVQSIIEQLEDGLGTMAMVNYPYPTNFTANIPANPVKAACDAAAAIRPSKEADANDVSVFDWSNIDQLFAAANIYFSYDNDTNCWNLNDESSQGLDDQGWTAQTCGEMAMPMGDDPATSCFSWTNWDYVAHNDFCNKTYGLTPEYDFALTYFGGMNPEKDFSSVSNVVWLNGMLDPWSTGGITYNLTSFNNTNSIALFVNGSAHHLDLRTPNEADPEEMVTARAIEKSYVLKWITDYQKVAPGALKSEL